jgi:hypothetical protein
MLTLWGKGGYGGSPNVEAGKGVSTGVALYSRCTAQYCIVGKKNYIHVKRSFNARYDNIRPKLSSMVMGLWEVTWDLGLGGGGGRGRHLAAQLLIGTCILLYYSR